MTDRKDLTSEVASASRDLLLPIWDGLCRPQDDILLTQGQGRDWRLYDDLARDAQVHAVLDKRIRAVAARDWEVRPADRDAGSRAARKAAELVERALSGFAFDAATVTLLDAILKGFAVVEVMWKVSEGGELLPSALIPRRQGRFVFGAAGDLRLLTREAPVMGEPLPDRKFLIHRHAPRDGDPYGLGLGHKLFWPVLFKRKGVSWSATFLEKFATPTPKGETPEGASPEEQDKLLDDLSRLAQESALVVPAGTKVDFLSAGNGTGVSDMYDRWVRYWDEQITLATLGETLTTSIGTAGSRAASETHNGVRVELTDADADSLSAGPYATLAQWVVDLNIPGAPYPTVWRPNPARTAETEDARERRLKRLQQQVATIQAARAAGFDAENPGADLEAQADGRFLPRTTDTLPAAAFAAPMVGRPTTPRDSVDDLVDQLDTAAAPQVAAWLAQVRAVLDGADSLEAVPDALLSLGPRLDATRMAALLERGMTVAHLTGAMEIDEGIST